MDWQEIDTIHTFADLVNARAERLIKEYEVHNAK